MKFSAKFLKEKDAPSYKQRIFTTGFADRDVRKLPVLLQRLNAILIDIRLYPVDRQPQWGKDYLKLLLKDKYRHIVSLGNRSLCGDQKVSIQNLPLGTRIIIDLQVNLVLICRCRDRTNCHRLVIARQLQEYGFEVCELDDWETNVDRLAK